MKSVKENMGAGRGQALQKLENYGLSTDEDISVVAKEILALGNTFAARESFLLIRDFLGENEIRAFSERGEFAFIIAVGKEIEDVVKKGAIEAVWMYNEAGKLPEGKESEFAKATCKTIFGAPDLLYEEVKNNVATSATLFLAVNSTQELISNMVEAKLKPVEEIRVPEQRMSMLERLVDSFIKFISELVAGKAEVKEEPVVEKEKTPMELLSEKANPWSGKVVGKEETPLER